MKKILAITLGGAEIPSSNFRLRCYYPYLEKSGFEVTEINTKEILKPNLPKIPKINAAVNILGLKDYFVSKNLRKFEEKVRDADIIWVNKILHERLLNIVKKYQKKVIFDIDDAIWIGAEETLQNNLAVAEIVVAGNHYLAEEIGKRFGGKIALVPTTIDISKYSETKKTEGKPLRIGWLGSSYTNDYLREIAPAINYFLKNNDAEFHIISGNFLGLKEFFLNKTFFHEWEENAYISQLFSWDIGIMPMPDSEWVKGKCSFKMLQYMAAELPVVVSPFGMNADILKKGDCGFGAKTAEDWVKSFDFLNENRETGKKMGKTGRQIVEKEFSTAENAKILNQIFSKITETL